MAPKCCRVKRQGFHVSGQISQTVHAGPALTCTLPFHVADHSSRLGQGTARSGEYSDNSGTQRRSKLASSLLGQAALEDVGHGDPASSVAPEKNPPVPVGILRGELKEVPEGNSMWCFHHLRFRPPAGDREQHGARRVIGSHRSEPLTTKPADHRHLRE